MTSLGSLITYRIRVASNSVEMRRAVAAVQVLTPPVMARKPTKRTARGIEVRRAYMKDIRRKARILGIAESGKGYCARVNAMWTAHLAAVELAAYNYADRS